ncbi:MAG: hypothetical protein IJ298_00285 [Ruminococcus sp.]|nr:hypothetical protein [Ruminococcus sp.]
MTEKLFKKLEAAGGIVVFAIASFLHFLFELTGESVLGALLGAVNESVWEHLKIFAIAYLIWAVVELLWAQPPLKAFVWAKAVGVYALCISIAGFFYLYTGLLGKSVLIVDLLSGLVFSFLAHYISYKLTVSCRNRGQFFYTGLMLLFLMLVMILCFTYYPPEADLFRDPVTGEYGVPVDIPDPGARVLDTLYMK